MSYDALHMTVASLAFAVTVYYRVPQAKRSAFEARFPRLAALIGMIAALVPFLPMFVDNFKKLAHGEQPPSPPWHEGPNQ